MAIIRRSIYLTGTVQGVGLRGTVVRLANQQGISGTIENLPNGRVHLVMEGEEQTVQEFEQQLVDLNGEIHIEEIIVADESPPSGDFSTMTWKVDGFTGVAREMAPGGRAGTV